MPIKDQLRNNIVLIFSLMLNFIVICVCSILLYYNLNSKITNIESKLEIYGTSILTKTSEINDKCDQLCIAHDSHVAHTEAIFKSIQYSICDNKDTIEELKEKIEMIKDIEIDIAQKNKINTKQYEYVKEQPKEQIKEEEKIVKNDGNTEDLYSDPVFALCPSYSKGDDLREAIKDLRVILIKFKIKNTNDIEMLDRFDYITFTEEYNKYLKNCKNGKYHHNFIVRFWRWLRN